MGGKIHKTKLCFFLIIMLISTAFFIGEYEISASEFNNNYIDVSLSIDKNEYNAGEDVEISIAVTNTHDVAVNSVTYTSSLHSDVWVVDNEDDEVYRWSHGKYFLPIVETEYLLPHETKYSNYTWNGTDNDGHPVPAGIYEITGSVDGFTTNTVTITLNSCIDVSLSTDKSEYTMGEDVEISIPITNTCDRPVNMEYTAPFSDFWVVDDEGNEVHRWSHDKFFLQVILTETWSAYETKYSNYTWNGTDNDGHPVPAGIYEITGSVDGFTTNTVTITLNSCIDVSLSTDKSEYTMGEDIDISIVATNTCDRPVNVTFNNMNIIRSDFWVVDNEGKRVYGEYDDVVRLWGMVTETWSVYETRHFNFTWDGKDNDGIYVPDGTYEITGSVDGFTTNTVTISFGHIIYIKPIVNIFPSTNIITIGDTLTINGTCFHGENNETVEKVEIKIGDGEWIQVNGIDDWNFIWDAKDVESGLYVIKVRAYDGQEYSNIKSTVVEVKEGDQTSNDTAGFEFAIFVVGIIATLIVAKRRKFKK
ncbi:MAG: BsuPI-related putative proteinase inhibitor [Candidatus Thermoplasmatota archaeon]|nr:BsuPI-related putative proteinase inhibitor [Candidatus Thermoplasmatota archaeon]